MNGKVKYLVLIVLSLAMVFPAATKAQSTEIDSLKKELNLLKTKLRKLEMKLEELSSKQTEVNIGEEETGKQKNLKPFQIKDNWRKLEIGMTYEKVKSLLGEPTRITAGRYSKIWWYEWVNKIYHNGHVSFGKNGKVVLWVEP